MEIDPIRCFVVRVGDDGVHELVLRGGDAVEVDGYVVIWLERALSIGAKLLGDGDEGVVADVAEASCFGAAVVVKVGSVIHEHSFVSVIAVSGARAGGGGDGTTSDGAYCSLQIQIHWRKNCNLEGKL